MDNTYYTGMTWDPGIRFEQHLSGFGGKYTGEHGVKKLVYLEEHEDFEVAREREQQIKGWSRKKKRRDSNKEFYVLIGCFSTSVEE